MPKIGVFDSGVGGLTVLKACVRLLPEAEFYYFGDNLNAPYGQRSEEEILSFVKSAMLRFLKLGIDAAVLACNTATSVCAERLRREFAFPIVGMEPAVSLAARTAKNVLVLCTPQTAAGERLSSLIARFPQTDFTVFPAKNLAAAVEDFLLRGVPIELSEHLPPPEALGERPFDGVVLGCTHYVFLRREIARFYGAPVFDGNEGTARRLSNLFPAKNPACANPPFPDKIRPANFPVFLGDCAKENEKIYKTNICSIFFL